MAKQKCGEIFLSHKKAYQCQQIRFTEHSHQDYSLDTQVKRGEMKVVPITPAIILDQMEKFFEVNKFAVRDEWIAHICKAIGKPYKKSHYLN